ncbi:MAG: GntR family transcriptional regulator [Ruminococcaceae bacterium]|nr:GntR family transcriptional regulator [Oscillospiraceae bacterium]
MINLDYKDSRTIHEQIEDELRKLIINGILAENEQLPSVRELSVSLTVNPNTVQRAYKQLEQDGFIYSIKGRGNFVAPVSKNNTEKRCEELFDALRTTTQELAFLGEEKEKLINVINNVFLEKEES